MKLSLLYYTQGKKINLLLLTILAKHLLSASLPWPTAWQSGDTGQPGTPHLQTKTNRQTEKSHQYHNTRPPFYLSALPLQCTTSQTRTYWALHFAESFQQFSSKDVSCKTKSLQLHAQKVPRTCSTLTGPAAVYCWLEKSTEECKKPLISMFYHKRFPVSTVTSVATGVRVWQHSGWPPDIVWLWMRYPACALKDP